MFVVLLSTTSLKEPSLRHFANLGSCRNDTKVDELNLSDSALVVTQITLSHPLETTVGVWHWLLFQWMTVQDVSWTLNLRWNVAPFYFRPLCSHLLLTAAIKAPGRETGGVKQKFCLLTQHWPTVCFSSCYGNRLALTAGMRLPTFDTYSSRGEKAACDGRCRLQEQWGAGEGGGFSHMHCFWSFTCVLVKLWICTLCLWFFFSLHPAPRCVHALKYSKRPSDAI